MEARMESNEAAGQDAFAKKAAGWDESPTRLAMAEAFFGRMRQYAGFGAACDALEFGCGTGLIGLRAAPLVRYLCMLDTSEAMLAVLRRKLATSGLRNVHVMRGDMAEADFADGTFHLAFSLMALHHVPDTAGLIRAFHRALRPGGRVVVGDLCSEDGSFHGGEDVPHRGFHVGELQGLFSAAGFTSSETGIFHTIVKPDAEGAMRRYRQFILTAWRG